MTYDPQTQISFKAGTRLKEKALEKAQRQGVTLKAVLTMAMNAFVKDELEIAVRPKGETPSPYLINAIRFSEEDLKKGRASPSFDNAEDAIKWLHRKSRKYARSV